jgi:hypothetical protein
MPPVKEFLELLNEMEKVHRKKNDDYAGNNNPYENFERAAYVASWFRDELDKVFVIMIVIKLARLGTLMSKFDNPKNESIADSQLDLTNYCGLWASYRTHKLNQIKVKEINKEPNKPYNPCLGSHVFSPNSTLPAQCLRCNCIINQESVGQLCDTVTALRARLAEVTQQRDAALDEWKARYDTPPWRSLERMYQEAYPGRDVVSRDVLRWADTFITARRTDKKTT